jgi:flagellar biosynthesis/type III secretory pathway chaperone
MWNELLDVLGKMNLVYRDVLTLGEKKHGTLVTIDMKGLDALLKQEQELLHQVQKLEKRRKEVMGKLAASVRGLTPESKMEELFSCAPSKPVEDRLKTLHKGLNELLRKVEERNQNNKILTQAALDAVGFHLNRLSGATAGNTYGNGGEDRVNQNKTLDFKA